MGKSEGLIDPLHESSVAAALAYEPAGSYHVFVPMFSCYGDAALSGQPFFLS